MPEPAIDVRGLSYRYPTATEEALRDLTLRIEPGEFVVLAGCSGSGKTTLLRAACGLVPHFHGGEFAGEVRVAGRSTREHGPAELALDVGFLAQDPETQVVSATVRSELALPLELRGRAPLERARGVEEVALALGLEALLDRTTDSLSGGELQRVAIGAALVTRPRLLLLDEPTSQLDPVAGDELIALLRRLNEEWGVAIVLGEHRLERCLAAADRVIALAAGEILYDGPRDGFGAVATERADGLATPAMTLFARAGLPQRPATVKAARIALGALAPGRPAALDPPEASPERQRGTRETVLIARDLRLERGIGRERREALRGLDLEIERGERVVLMGPNGAGKSSLLGAAAGLLEPSAGSISSARGCALLSQRPDDYLVRERLGDELPGPGGAAALAAVGLDVGADRDPRDLSGGERQRLAMAIAFAGRGAGGTAPGLVCLDEPTRGLDRERKRALAGWLEQLATAGSAILIATHDVEFAASFAERAVLLARGKVLAEGPVTELLAGGWYFATETARITDGAAITAEAGAELIRGRIETLGEPLR